MRTSARSESPVTSSAELGLAVPTIPESFSPRSVMNLHRHVERSRCLYVSTVIPSGWKRRCFDERGIPAITSSEPPSVFQYLNVNAGLSARRSSRMEVQDECHAELQVVRDHVL